jgi:hypothetical protein
VSKPALQRTVTDGTKRHKLRRLHDRLREPACAGWLLRAQIDFWNGQAMNKKAGLRTELQIDALLYRTPWWKRYPLKPRITPSGVICSRMRPGANSSPCTTISPLIMTRRSLGLFE